MKLSLNTSMPRVLHFGPLKKDRQLLTHYSTVQESDAAFYASYDALFLARKAQLLYGMYQHADSLVPALRTSATSLDATDDELRTLLATELHCTAYHQTEALIALVLAEYQDRPDWVYLTCYASSEIKEAAKGISTRFKEIPGTTAANLRQLVEQGVYAGWDLSKTELATPWSESIQSIMALLQIVAEQFLDGHEYNSYKHGLRVVLGSAAFGVGQGEVIRNNVHMLSVMRHAMTCLQIEKIEEHYGAAMVTKEIKPEYSFKVIQCMGSLLMTIKNFRVARINGTLPTEISLPLYDTVQLDQSKPIAKFAVSY